MFFSTQPHNFSPASTECGIHSPQPSASRIVIWLFRRVGCCMIGVITNKFPTTSILQNPLTCRVSSNNTASILVSHTPSEIGTH
ncbi:hypothetical protein BC936DRAFT_138819 [Jimgerdemannia flammicorona]|uniref:Uncharacterized protein n=1 Tax=Jimgerdemannia flammicorona TaxID=994334 RepID=A0A433BHC8_9FUNG|nr:hypothetical protein BC936DRAFT_138819 [Jimgerdemannia flammicorona]